MSSDPLSAAQLRHFAEEGFVVVPALVAAPQLEDYRTQFWGHIGADASDSATWPEAPPGGGQLPNIMALTPNIGELPGIAAVVEQLGGGRFVGGGSMTKAIFPTQFPLPNGAAEWQRPTGQHIDGYAGAWNNNPQVGATLYLSAVPEQGGCFSIWPQQHRHIHEYFHQRPHEIDGSFMQTEAYAELGWRALYEDTAEPEAPEYQFVGEAGSVLFWHGMVPHCASLNAHSCPRLAMIARWQDPDLNDKPVKLSPTGKYTFAIFLAKPSISIHSPSFLLQNPSVSAQNRAPIPTATRLPRV